jgi:hypothetical protein
MGTILWVSPIAPFRASITLPPYQGAYDLFFHKPVQALGHLEYGHAGGLQFIARTKTKWAAYFINSSNGQNSFKESEKRVIHKNTFRIAKVVG